MRTDVDGSDIVLQTRLGRAEDKSAVTVVPGGVSFHCEGPGVTIIDESFLQVGKRDRVSNDVISGWDCTRGAAAELEAVAVTFKGGEAPSVVAIAPREGVFNGHRRCKFPDSLIRVVESVC